MFDSTLPFNTLSHSERQVPRYQLVTIENPSAATSAANVNGSLLTTLSKVPRPRPPALARTLSAGAPPIRLLRL